MPRPKATIRTLRPSIYPSVRSSIHPSTIMTRPGGLLWRRPRVGPVLNVERSVGWLTDCLGSQPKRSSVGRFLIPISRHTTRAAAATTGDAMNGELQYCDVCSLAGCQNRNGALLNIFRRVDDVHTLWFIKMWLYICDHISGKTLIWFL